MGYTPKDITGSKFGRLTAIKSTNQKDKWGHYYWEFLCDCGNTKVTTVSSAGRGIKSCGCLAKEARELNFYPHQIPYIGAGSSYNRIYRTYRYNAISRSIKFELSVDDLINLISKPCYYCGILNSNLMKDYKREIRYNGIDRVDPLIGYTLSNVVPCCKICNTAKLNLTIVDFKIWVSKVFHHLNLE